MNISYEVTAGSLQDLSRIEGALADPGEDFISGTGSVILQEGQTSVAIPVTILEVKADVFCKPSKQKENRTSLVGVHFLIIILQKKTYVMISFGFFCYSHVFSEQGSRNAALKVFLFPFFFFRMKSRSYGSFFWLT